MKKKGFTLIELLAVIVILAVIALIAIPIVLDIVNNSKKNAFKNSVYALTEAAGNYVGYEQVKGNKIEWKTNKITGEEYVSFNLSKKEDIEKLNLKGKIPKKGRVEITKNGDTFVVAIEDNLCGKKNFGESNVNLLSLRTDDICLLTSQTGGLDSEEADDLISTVTDLVNKVNTLEEKVDTIKSETINNIYPVGSIYISTELSTVEEVQNKIGGKWEVYGDGKVLKGTTGKSGETGGSSNVSLTTANLPEHNHSYTSSGSVSSTFTGTEVTSGSTGSGYSIGLTYATRTSGIQSVNHTHSGTSESAGNHTHNLPYLWAGNSSGSRNYTIDGYPRSNASGQYAIDTASSGAHTHSFTTGANSANHTHNYNDYYANSISGVQAHTHNVTAKGSVSSTFTGTKSNTESTGSNTAFSVLDPYITVYMYKRVK